MSTDLPSVRKEAGTSVSTQNTSADTPAPSARGQAVQRQTPPRPAAQKAAAVLALLDEQTLKQLAGRFPDRHRDKLLAAARSLRGVDRKEQKRIAQEFAGEFAAVRGALRGGEDIATRLEETLFLPAPEDLAETTDFEPTPLALPPASVWDRVAEVPIPKLAAFLSSMPPAVVSLSLARLPEMIVGDIVNELDGVILTDSMLHMAANAKGHPIAIEAVEHLVETRLLASDPDEDDGAGPSPAAGGGTDGAHADKVAGLLNRMISSRREEIVKRLNGEVDEDTVVEIMDRVLSFSALESRLPRNAIPVLLREADEKNLLKAFKYAGGKDQQVVDYLLNNISQRLAATYREKLEAMEDVDEDAGEKAQSAFICELLALAEQGKITLLSKDEE